MAQVAVRDDGAALAAAVATLRDAVASLASPVREFDYDRFVRLWETAGDEGRYQAVLAELVRQTRQVASSHPGGTDMEAEAAHDGPRRAG